MSEAGPVFFEPTFNRAIKVRSRDERITSDAGVLLLREADERLGLVKSLSEQLRDPRHPLKIRYKFNELLRERLYALALNYSACDDLDRLAHDPAFRISVWDRPGERPLDERLASQPTQTRVVDTLKDKRNLEQLRGALADWTERHCRGTSRGKGLMRATIDVDGLPIAAYGTQPGTAFNGYYGEKVYYPLVASLAPQGDYDSRRLGDGFVHAMLRKGNAGAAEGALRFIRTAHRRCSSWARVIDFRLDAGFTIGSVMDGLTEDEVRFVGRLKLNPVLQRLAEPHVTRPVGRPPGEGYEYTEELGAHQPESWRHSQRLVLCVVDKPDSKTGQLELFPRYFVLVTNWKAEELSADGLLEHYRRRGTFEDRLGELGGAISPRLSSPNFAENEVIFLLSLLAFNLGNMLRGEIEAVATEGRGWDLERIQTSLLKAGARIVKSGRRLFVDVARAVLPIWRHLTARLERWRLSPSWLPPPRRAPSGWVPPPRHAHLHAVLRM